MASPKEEISMIVNKIKNLDKGTRFKCVASDLFRTYILYGRVGQEHNNIIRFIFIEIDIECKYKHGYFFLNDDIEFILYESDCNNINYFDKLVSLKGDIKFFAEI